MVNEPGAWLVTAGWSVGRVLQPLLSPPLPGPEQNLVSGQPLGPWHQEKRAGSAASGAFVFTSPQLASCQTCVIPGRSRGPCRDPPPHAQHRTPLFFSSLGTAEQVKPTQTAGPHAPGGNNHLVPDVGARGLWTRKSNTPSRPARPLGPRPLLSVLSLHPEPRTLHSLPLCPCQQLPPMGCVSWASISSLFSPTQLPLTRLCPCLLE